MRHVTQGVGAQQAESGAQIQTQPIAVKDKGDEDADSDSPPGIVDFDPASLVRSKEGTMKVPKPIQRYLDKHLKHCLTKEEREALFKEHPRPDLEATLAPKVDKYISDFLGKKFPREQDTELMKIQTAVLACICPLTSVGKNS